MPMIVMTVSSSTNVNALDLSSHDFRFMARAESVRRGHRYPVHSAWHSGSHKSEILNRYSSKSRRIRSPDTSIRTPARYCSGMILTISGWGGAYLFVLDPTMRPVVLVA